MCSQWTLQDSFHTPNPLINTLTSQKSVPTVNTKP